MRLTVEQVMKDNKRFANCNALAELKYCGWDIPHRKSITNDDIHFYAWLCRSAVAMLKEQQPKKGHWFIDEYEYLDCSVCGEAYFTGCESTAEAKRRLEKGEHYNYCPYCGADMRTDGEQE